MELSHDSGRTVRPIGLRIDRLRQGKNIQPQSRSAVRVPLTHVCRKDTLKEAVEILAQARMAVSIYNHPLCVLDPSIVAFSRKSISDWKNEYMPECDGCTRKNGCGGFFSSARIRHSKYIQPFRDDIASKVEAS
jgi:hypothetical protein